jgi:hypothetical protein
MEESGTPSSLLDQLLDSANSRPLAMIGQQQGPGAAPVPAIDDIQMPPGAWGIGVSQEVRPEGISYKVRVCVHGQARYLGRWVGRVGKFNRLMSIRLANTARHCFKAD